MGDLAVYVAGFARTPFGRFGGALAAVSLPELGAVAVRGAMARAATEPEEVDELAFGVNFPGGDRSIARQVQLRSGIPADRVSFTVDRACCSSLAAITLASRGLRLGDTRRSVAGGVENLSRVPYFVEQVRWGRRLGDLVLVDQLVVSCPHTGVPRAVQAADEATSMGIGRTEQDEWACRSQELYAVAAAKGYFDEEVVPVEVALEDGTQVSLARDEPPRPTTTAEVLATLPTVYGSATVTAGNAPDLSSGAACLVLTSEPAGPIRARLSSWTMASGEPHRIASMPAVAGRLALEREGITLDDVDVFEVNEAFAAVPLVTTLVLADHDEVVARKIRERTNLLGGAVAVGHPTGATAARLVMSAIGQLQRRGGGVGLVTICGGVGEAEAVVVRVDAT